MIGNYIALGFLFLITLESLLIKAASFFQWYELKVDNLTLYDQRKISLEQWEQKEKLVHPKESLFH